MSIVLRCFVAGFCLLLFFVVIKLVSREQLLLKYSLLWLFLALTLFCSALFPDILFVLSTKLGFVTPVNFIFFIGLFCLLAISLSLTVIASKQAIKIKNLVQRLAILEHELDNKGKPKESAGDETNVSI